jgi:hypothetical protein
MVRVRSPNARRLGIVAMLAGMMLAPAMALGAPTSKEGVEEAELVRRGTEAFVHQDYEAARAQFARAYQLAAKPKTLLQLGLAELHSDHPVEAVAHLREYLTHTEQPADKLEAVRTKWLPRAEARTARLDIVAPAGAEVSIDGVLQGQAPLPSIVVCEGAHDVSARQGALEQTQHVSAHGGELVDVSIELTGPSPTDAAPSPSAANAASTPGPAPEPPPPTSSNAKWITVLATGGGAVVAAGIGIGFALASQQSSKDLQATRSLIDVASNPSQPAWNGNECYAPSSSTASLCSRLDGQSASQNRLATASNWAYGIAGVLGAASVASFLLWPGSSVHLQPMIGSRIAGLSAGRAW